MSTTKTKIAPPTVEEFMTLLSVPVMPSKEKRKARLQSRIIGLGFGKICGRCGGCGQYSYNPMDGTRCFGCVGTGFVAQNLTAKLFASLSEAVAAGKLADYLEGLRVRALAVQSAKSAIDRTMAAWQGSGVSKAYDWTKATNHEGNAWNKYDPIDAAISHEINAPMCAQFDIVKELSYALDAIGNRKVTTIAEREAKEAEVIAKREELIATTEQAIAEINRLAALIPEYTARRTQS